MSLDMNSGPSRSSSQELWPKWMWIAVPVLVVVVVAGLWWAILSPPDASAPVPTATPTARLITTQPTQAPTMLATLAIEAVAPTLQQVLPTLATFTPVPAEVAATPTGEPTAAPATTLAVGGKAVANAGAGLNMRSNAGTGQSIVQRLPKGAEVEVIGGPKEANNYTWWQVRDSAGVTGWVASEFLDPK